MRKRRRNVIKEIVSVDVTRMMDSVAAMTVAMQLLRWMREDPEFRQQVMELLHDQARKKTL